MDPADRYCNGILRSHGLCAWEKPKEADFAAVLARGGEVHVVRLDPRHDVPVAHWGGPCGIHRPVVWPDHSGAKT